MRSYGEGGLSATIPTGRVKGIEPRNNPYCIGSRVSCPGNQYQDAR